MEDYRKSHLAAGKGKSYHAAFSNNSYRAIIWEMEKVLLGRIMERFLIGRRISHLDFACGTGRILAYCEEYSDISLGVDVSASMLDVARKNVRRGELIQADLTIKDVLGKRKFNFITAFRFFPNAQPELRIAVMQILTNHLEDGGYIVFNNHKNTGSIRRRLAYMCGRNSDRGMSMEEVSGLLDSNGLKVDHVYPLSIFPTTETRMLLPKFLLMPLEKFLCCLPMFRNLGGNLIFVCRITKT